MNKPLWRSHDRSHNRSQWQQVPRPDYSTGFDARFPNQNQTKHCWQNYVDYHKCILAKGEDFAPCRQVSTFCVSSTRMLTLYSFSWPTSLFAPARGVKGTIFLFMGSCQSYLPWFWITTAETNSAIYRWDDQREKGTFPTRLDQ